MTTSIVYYCSVCGEPNETFVDSSGGTAQEYVEDCQVCCRPNILRIRIDDESGEVSVESEFEG
jgi:hypothetical protein